MTHDHGKEPGHSHNHADDCQDELSAKYSEYVESHLEALRKKCEQINVCIDNLLEDENVILLVKGYDLRLNKTCSLVYKGNTDTFSNHTGKCTPEEKEDIRTDIEEHLKSHIEGADTPDWKKVRTCLTKRYGDKERSSHVDDICRLAYNKTQICTNYSTHKTVENFFNDQIYHLKCTCRTLNINDASKVSVPILIGAAAGVVLFLVLLFLLGCVCYYRWRKSQKRNKRVPNVIYMPAPNSEGYPVYQEVYDDRGYRPSPSNNPPALPKRYTTSPMEDHENEPAYLEPVIANARPKMPVPGTANAGYDAPPVYTEKDIIDGANSVNRNVHPQASPNEDRGYDTMSRNKPSDPSQGSAQTKEPLLGPVPALRMKKDDRNTESHYFVLETNDGNARNSSV